MTKKLIIIEIVALIVSAPIAFGGCSVDTTRSNSERITALEAKLEAMKLQNDQTMKRVDGVALTLAGLTKRVMKLEGKELSTK